MWGIEFRSLCLLAKPSIPEPYPQPNFSFLFGHQVTLKYDPSQWPYLNVCKDFFSRNEVTLWDSDLWGRGWSTFQLIKHRHYRIKAFSSPLQRKKTRLKPTWLMSGAGRGGVKGQNQPNLKFCALPVPTTLPFPHRVTFLQFLKGQVTFLKMNVCACDVLNLATGAASHFCLEESSCPCCWINTMRNPHSSPHSPGNS